MPQQAECDCPGPEMILPTCAIHGEGQPPTRERIDADEIRRRLGRDWKPAQPLGDDGWVFEGPNRRIIVTIDLSSERGIHWIHASVAYRDVWRMPTYFDLKQMHRAVFDGFAYQVFAPESAHINVRANALHIWGRQDGQPGLPDFGRFGSI